MSSIFDYVKSNVQQKEPVTKKSPIFDFAQNELEKEKEGPSEVSKMKTELLGRGSEIGASLAGVPRRFLEFINLAPSLTKKHLGFGKPLTEEQLEKLPNTEEAYQYLSEKLGIDREMDPTFVDVAKSAADLMAFGTPPPLALTMALGGKLFQKGTEKLEASPTIQSIARGIGEITPALISKGKVSPLTLPKGVKLTPQETMAVTKGAERTKGTLFKAAKPTKKAKEIVQSLENKLEESTKNIIGDSIVGFSKGGLEGAEKIASHGYDLVRQEAKRFPKTFVPKRLQGTLDAIEQDIKKSGVITDVEKSVLQIINDTKNASSKGTNAENLIDLFFKFNDVVRKNLGKRGSPYLERAKSSLKQELGLVDKGLAEGFDKATEQYKKIQNFKNIYPILEDTVFGTKTNFKKLEKALKNPDKRKSFERAFGKEGRNNLEKISKYGLSKEELEKLFTPSEMRGFLEGLGSAVELGGAVWSAMTFNIPALISSVGPEMARRILTKMIIDPKYSNLTKSLRAAVKTNKKSIALQLSKRFSDFIEESLKNQSNEIEEL